MPAHHLLEQYLDAYVTAASFAGEKNAPLIPIVSRAQGKMVPGQTDATSAAKRVFS